MELSKVFCEDRNVSPEVMSQIDRCGCRNLDKGKKKKLNKKERQMHLSQRENPTGGMKWNIMD